MRKRPEASGIRRTFRPVESTGEGSPGPTGGLRGTSLPAAVLPKEGTDKRPLSAHSVLNSITRHSSLKAKVESPQFRRGTPAGRSKSFSNHRPLDPEVFSQVELGSQVRHRISFYLQLLLLQNCHLLSSWQYNNKTFVNKISYSLAAWFWGVKWWDEACSVSSSSKHCFIFPPHPLWVLATESSIIFFLFNCYCKLW